MRESIHWHEGQFLQPHHFQAFQRAVAGTFARERELGIAYPYGVISMSLAVDDLEDFQLRFKSLEAVMPSGVHVSFPANASLPATGFRKTFDTHPDGFMVYLAVPVWAAKRANLLENPKEVGKRIKLLYHVENAEIADENTGENEQVVQKRLTNALLVFEGEETADLEVIPLLRIKRETTEDGAGRPRLDRYFVPPTLLMRGSDMLFNLFRDLAGQVSAVHTELAAHLGNSSFDIKTAQGLPFEQFLRLRTLTRFEGRLNTLTATDNLTPLAAYLELRDLFADLVCFVPQDKNFEIEPYDHDDPYPCFETLNRKIRLYLEGDPEKHYRVIPFEPLDDYYYQGEIRPELLDGGTAYYLAVETEHNPSHVTALIENRDDFKLIPMSYGQRAMRGVVLREDRHPPVHLPMRAKRYYYRLETGESPTVWEDIQKEPIAFIELRSAKSTDYDISLYILVPPSRDGS